MAGAASATIDTVATGLARVFACAGMRHLERKRPSARPGESIVIRHGGDVAREASTASA